MAMDDFLAGIPLFGGLFDNSSGEAMNYMNKILKEYEGLNLPDVSWKDYNPEMYSSDYSPEAYQATLNKEDPRLLQQQRDYLARLSGLSESGMTEGDKAGYDMARQMASSEAKSQRDALARQAMASGTYGGGQDFMSRQMANQSGADRAQTAALAQAQDAARQKALYAQAYGNQLGNVRNQDFATESSNKDIINRFNQMNTQGRNAAAMNRQDINNQNVGLRNQAQGTNLQGRINQNQAQYNNQRGRAGDMSGIWDKYGSYYSNLAAKRAGSREAGGKAIGQIIGGIYGGPAGSQIGGAAGSQVGDLF
jgi:hypothetical protein